MRQKCADNPVLLYKPQGHKPMTDCQYLDNDDFVLILQAPLQCAIMKEFRTTSFVLTQQTRQQDMTFSRPQ